MDIISNIYADYLSARQAHVRGTNFNTPEFAKLSEFKVNTEFIKNKRAKEFIEHCDEFHDLFKIMLGSFKNEKKKASSEISESMIPEINKVVEMIYKQITKKSKVIENDTLLDFEEFIKTQK